MRIGMVRVRIEELWRIPRMIVGRNQRFAQALDHGEGCTISVNCGVIAFPEDGAAG